MKLLKRGTKFRIAPYGVCVVSSYDDTSGKYIMRVWNSSETFYASKEEIDKKRLDNPITLWYNVYKKVR